MNIAVCDNEEIFANGIHDKLEKIFSQLNREADLDVFTDPEQLCDSDKRYDIAFLDVEMPKLTGLDAAKTLKSKNPYIIIFMITAHDGYQDDAMDLNVFRYLSKPVNEERLKRGVERALDKLDNEDIGYYIKNNSQEVYVYARDIEYIEIYKRYTKLITNSGELISNKSIGSWDELLSSKYFYRIHKSYIVNVNYITSYTHDRVIMKNGNTVPIAYRKRKDFKKYFLSCTAGLHV